MSLKLNERYPGRFNNPSADYPGGSFKNRTTPDAKDGSYLEKDWANDKEGFFQSIIAGAGALPNGLVDKVGASQFFDCLLQLAQNQIAQAFPTAGTSTALTLTPVPAISAYTANQRFSVKFHVASGANPTLNASAKGAKGLKQYNAAGAKVAAVFFADQVGDVVYDGTDWVLMNSIPAAFIEEPSAVKAFARNTAPTGWLKANGAAVSRTVYDKLFAAIGTTFGAGDGSTTFNIPDLRGEFIRGWDDGRNIDTGRVFGSSQLDSLQNVTGNVGGVRNDAASVTPSGAFLNLGSAGNFTNGGAQMSNVNFDMSRVARTSTETRSRNVALLLCIKF